jgi:hypothetical protein
LESVPYFTDYRSMGNISEKSSNISRKLLSLSIGVTKVNFMWCVFHNAQWYWSDNLCKLVTDKISITRGKIGWSSTSNRNFMSFREWSAAKRAKRNTKFYHEWKITWAVPTTHVSTYRWTTQVNLKKTTVVCHECVRKMADVISTFVFQAEKNYSFSYSEKRKMIFQL